MSDIIILNEEEKNTSDNNIIKVNGDEWKFLIDKLNDLLLSFQNVKTKEKVIFYRLLATMTNAWMSLLKSMMVLEKQEKNRVLKKILWRFCEELKDWAALSSCLELYYNSFEAAEVWIIRSWEKTWRLNIALTNIEPVKLALVKLASVILVWLKSALVTFAPVKLALVKSLWLKEQLLIVI